MKNFVKFPGNLNLALRTKGSLAKVPLLLAVIVTVIGLSMTGCPEEDKGGDLTITGLDAYEGKWVTAISLDYFNTDLEADEFRCLFAAGEADNKGTSKGGKISGGSVTLNVYVGKMNSETISVSGFTGSGSAEFEVDIGNNEISDDEVAYGSVTVTFKNGSASGKVENLRAAN